MRANSHKSRSNIYETITNKIVSAIEKKSRDPIMPWQRGGARPVLPTNALTSQPYRGVNILSLWVQRWSAVTAPVNLRPCANGMKRVHRFARAMSTPL